MTLEELEKNMTITDERLYEAVMSLALDIEKAAQVERLEREKAELIEKAEELIAAWDHKFGPAMLDTYVAALRDAVEKVKESKK